jgi:hypothetical protein
MRLEPWERDRITDAILLGAPRSEHSAQTETLDMQEVTGSSPVSPTIPPIPVPSRAPRDEDHVANPRIVIGRCAVARRVFAR